MTPITMHARQSAPPPAAPITFIALPSLANFIMTTLYFALVPQKF